MNCSLLENPQIFSKQLFVSLHCVSYSVTSKAGRNRPTACHHQENNLVFDRVLFSYAVQKAIGSLLNKSNQINTP